MAASDITPVVLRDNTANPAALGLLAFGSTTVLLNLANIGCYPLNSMILAMGIFYGGLAQVIAGIMEWKKGNTFGTTAFTSYGMFWLTLVGLIVLPTFVPAIKGPTAAGMSSYMFVWGIFTFALFVGTLRLNRALQFVFITLTILFVLLGVHELKGGATLLHVAGYIGLACGGSAMYTGFAVVLADVYGRSILPVGPV